MFIEFTQGRAHHPLVFLWKTKQAHTHSALYVVSLIVGQRMCSGRAPLRTVPFTKTEAAFSEPVREVGPSLL